MDKVNIAIKIFKALAESADSYRKGAFLKTITILKKWDEIPDNPIKVKGIGKGIATRLLEIKETGTLAEYEKLQDDPIQQCIRELVQIPGIGVKVAEKLIEKYGIKRCDPKKILDDEEIAEDLTSAQKIGAQYQNELKRRIPRKQITDFGKEMNKKIIKVNKNLKMEVAGSYRRKCKDCGDIDVLLYLDKGMYTKKQVSRSTILPKVAKQLEEWTLGVIGLGKTKCTLIINWPPGSKEARHLDLRFIPRNSVASALQYFTGSAQFNVLLRKHAISKGMLLSEYGLFMGETQIKTRTERELFEALGVEAVAPENRTEEKAKEIIANAV